MTSYDLSGRHALVTGGAQGLGEGMARALAAAGASVVIGDVQESGADVATSLGEGHGFVRLDVTDEDSWAAAVSSTVDQTGGFDLLVNNAGIEITSLITDIEPADVRRMLDVNVLGTALGLKHALRAMRPGGAAGKGGSVVNIARWQRRSRSRASRCTPPPSRPSTASPASRRWRAASWATASA
jgi:NAD(P)-dependent dehydrogenase (short-subunit alcohol dehydrogenase family)